MLFYKIIDSNARKVNIVWQQGEPDECDTWKLLQILLPHNRQCVEMDIHSRELERMFNRATNIIITKEVADLKKIKEKKEAANIGYGRYPPNKFKILIRRVRELEQTI